MNKKIAITLSGGGARGAYEAGVLRAIAEMGHFGTCPFQIITGVSAGAINGMSLASQAQDFDLATRTLWDTWENLQTEDVFKSDPLTLVKTGAQWVMDSCLGQWTGGPGMTHLLDTSPLREFLTEKIDVVAVARNLREGNLQAISLSATDYYSGKLVTFFDGASLIKTWDEVSSLGVRTKLSVEHIMASSAIPIFFPPVRLGDSEFGDGGIGLRSPLSDAIHLGGEKIFVIGLQYSPPTAQNPSQDRRKPITLGDIAGTILNALFTNSLDSDLGRLEQTNQTISSLIPVGRRDDPGVMREIPALVIQPSQNLGSVDAEHFSRLPYPLRHLLKGVGVSKQKGWELLSYLAFEKGYVSALLNLGYEDAKKQKRSILEFLA